MEVLGERDDAHGDSNFWREETETMRKVGPAVGIMWLSILSSSLVRQSQSPLLGAAESVQVIEVSARKYEFTRNEMHLKKGTRVELKPRTADSAHGLQLNPYAEGARKDGNPGLLFDHPQGSAKVKKDQESIFEFVSAAHRNL